MKIGAIFWKSPWNSPCLITGCRKFQKMLVFSVLQNALTLHIRMTIELIFLMVYCMSENLSCLLVERGTYSTWNQNFTTSVSPQKAVRNSISRTSGKKAFIYGLSFKNSKGELPLSFAKKSAYSQGKNGTFFSEKEHSSCWIFRCWENHICTACFWFSVKNEKRWE